MPMLRAVLTIAGSDSSGGAGIQADLKTFTALGVYGASVITALTAQNTRGVSGILPVPAHFVARQIAAVAGDLPLGAVKTGMLGTPDVVRQVAAAVERHGLRPLVVDPVMAATSGDSLAEPGVCEALRRDLLPLARLVTPNLGEAARLLGTSLAAAPGGMRDQACALVALGAEAALVTGGHGSGAMATDVLVTRTGEAQAFALPRIATGNTHGTGCTLSAAIAALLASGCSLPEAIHRAKAFVWEALRSGATYTVGRGRGPVDHLHALRPGGRNTTGT